MLNLIDNSGAAEIFVGTTHRIIQLRPLPTGVGGGI